MLGQSCSASADSSRALRLGVAHVAEENLLDRVPALAWGAGRECTFAGALEAALAPTNAPFSYADLMGFSGLAFRLRWSCWDKTPAWCPSCPIGELPEEVAAIEKATGWRFEWISAEDWSQPHMDRFAPDIVASIDAGLPVLAYTDSMDMAVVYGYRSGGASFLVRDYSAGDTPREVPATSLGPLVLLLRGTERALEPRDALREALRTAVRNWERGRASIAGADYWYGDSAYEAWIRDLDDVSAFTPEQRDALCGVSSWNFNCLVDARRAGVRFLSERIDLVEGPARAALERAERFALRNVEALADVSAGVEAFLGWERATEWTPEIARREREVLAHARYSDAATIAQFAEALVPVHAWGP